MSCTSSASSIASSAATYSAAVLDLVTMVCFLLAPVTGHPKRNTTRPEMDLRSTWSFTQSASEATVMYTFVNPSWQQYKAKPSVP
ncbi:hypothetical protein PF005_g13631 [Phytophthora fragariae]|uniref:Uncharacterized protein n=1 Tax=Phytophthora fragariae TaxID=53985 RepID=A0A6A3TV45_9STRA|nr:hypothetical protein PF003_g32611 [Phytophthora fragariae]KAE8935115.1 hypothetical protein PF009_g14927 [Phytophthora fragariae]KAE9104706.1 hypothetical protein PF010_g13293 [Phytophthora fragariae]KAE9106674.1 hypothetical protein PF007_g13324 [Phytophthora fragariae]KAE9143064.1 hypothetical protein PF006_g11887 [Phytophthora fragariae]